MAHGAWPRGEGGGTVRAVVQRVSKAAVWVDDAVVGEITKPGLCVLLGVTHDDDQVRAVRMAEKLWTLRVLRDERSCAELDAPLLLVSQFTLYGDTRKGRRPSWGAAAPGELAEPLFDAVVAALRERGARVATGVFGADMRVALTNEGPFTVIVDI
jgi:D-aminoacyl-tRNA deacylase